MYIARYDLECRQLMAFADEEDIFGSDFESTDEETNQVDELAGDKVVDDEEKRARKVDL